MVVQFIVFRTLSTLICRSTDISKCFSESLGIRDNESRLYFMFQVDTDSQVPYKQAMTVSNRVGAVCYVECSSLSGDGIQDLIKETVETVEKTVECTNKNRSCCSCNILWWNWESVAHTMRPLDTLYGWLVCCTAVLELVARAMFWEEQTINTKHIFKPGRHPGECREMCGCILTKSGIVAYTCHADLPTNLDNGLYTLFSFFSNFMQSWRKFYHWHLWPFDVPGQF